jgi:hypothetical protein
MVSQPITLTSAMIATKICFSVRAACPESIWLMSGLFECIFGSADHMSALIGCMLETVD